jgi:3-dehydroquinate synthase
MLLQRVTVPFEYPVYFTRDVFHADNPTLAEALRRTEPARRHRALVVIDSGVADMRPSSWQDEVARYFGAHGVDLVDQIVVEGGEGIKNDRAALEGLLARMNALGLDRQSFVVVAGGGAVLDMAGYAAALVHRGVRVVRLPTTVLAQADSGVGVKNGVNAFGKKNFLGTFAPPFAVVNDAAFLETLSRRDALAGMAEAVKVALVRDAAFFGWMRGQAGSLAAREPRAVAELVRRSAELHLAHIAGSGDPFELGSARPLDFGHWAAHKLESLTQHRLRHGEAVAIGVAIDTVYSAARGLCAVRVADAVLDVLARIGLPTWDDAVDERGSDGRPLVLEGLHEFREHLGGELTVTLLRGVGQGVEVHAIDESVLLASIACLRARADARRAA